MTKSRDIKGSLVRTSSFEQELSMAGREQSTERRGNARRPSDYNAECRLGPVAYVVEIRDISSTGACLHIRQGIVPREGQLVSLRLMDGRTIDAIVKRSAEVEVGVQFLEPIEINDVAHFDEMGSEFYTTVLKFQMATK